MKKNILLICGMFIAMQNALSVEAGLYYCIPVHAAHLIQADDGSITELILDTQDVVHIIVISTDSIEFSDNRFEDSKQIDVISNDLNGNILGRSETRRFYMGQNLHYFYGSTDVNNTVAYAEDGMCRKISYEDFTPSS